jgi:hypothetical protein
MPSSPTNAYKVNKVLQYQKEEGRRKKEEGISNKINNLRNLKGANHQGGCYAKQSGDFKLEI